MRSDKERRRDRFAVAWTIVVGVAFVIALAFLLADAVQAVPPINIGDK